MADRVAIGRANQLHGVGRQAALGGGFGQQLRNGLVGMGRFFAAAQNHRIAAFDANGRGIGRDIGPRFINEEHDSQRARGPSALRAHWVEWSTR